MNAGGSFLLHCLIGLSMLCHWLLICEHEDCDQQTLPVRRGLMCKYNFFLKLWWALLLFWIHLNTSCGWRACSRGWTGLVWAHKGSDCDARLLCSDDFDRSGAHQWQEDSVGQVRHAGAEPGTFCWRWRSVEGDQRQDPGHIDGKFHGVGNGKGKFHGGGPPWHFVYTLFRRDIAISTSLRYITLCCLIWFYTNTIFCFSFDVIWYNNI